MSHSRPSREGARGWLKALGLAVPGTLSFALGCIQLGSRSIWIDESASISIARQHGAALTSAIARDGGNMAGYYVLLHVIVAICGDGLVAVRMPSVIGFALTSTLVAVLGLRLFGYRGALAAGLLAAISMPSVFWAQDARSYALLAMFAAASYLALVIFLDAPLHATNSRVAAVVYVITTVAALYMSFVAAFIVVAQVLFVLATKQRRLRPFIVAEAGVLVLSIPLAAIAIHRGSGQLFWVPRPDWTSIKQVAVAVTSAGFQPDFAISTAGLVTLFATLALLAIRLVSWLAKKTPGSPRLTRKTASELGAALSISWLAVPLLAAFAESFITAPSFTDRNLLIVVPALALALGGLLTSPRCPLLLGYGALAALLALRLVVLIPTYGKSPEDWNHATDLLVAASTPGTCVVFYPSDTRMAVTYYLQTQHRDALSLFRPVLPAAPLTRTVPYLEDYRTLDAKQLTSITKSCQSLWLITSHEGSPNGTATSQANYQRFIDLRHALQAAYPPRQAFSFGWAAPVTLEFFKR